MSLRNVLTIVFLLVCGTGLFFIFNSSVSEGKVDADKQYRNYFNEHYKIFAVDIPDTFSFAGEKMPLHVHDVKERWDRELMVNTYWQSQSLLMFKRANRWFPVIEPILAEEGVPDDFKYLSVAESGLSNVVSPAKAVGFWQFLKGTAQEYDLEVREGVDERYNVELATRAACAYLKECKEKYGSWTMAAAAYNFGQRNLDKQLSRQEVDNYYDLLLNEETARYIFRVSAYKEILSHPAKYGFHFRPNDLYRPYRTETVKVDTSITDMAAFARSFGINYKNLKILNPWLRDNVLSNPRGKEYLIKIPSENEDGFRNAED
ncbi:MAG: lytic transglycosylase domain-containing protein [Flavobacteriales bacterium]|nr:lytic transglycosylase domain-containing protein [Flavobacteriales bacterium]